jgi:tRNA/tmRNA/rRNA uracil-C5-methylase (TrmA/RlmC/RlmD family)
MTPKYKPYVGRIFSLKKTKVIPASEDMHAKTRKHYKNQETFGEICLVVDETNTRVKVTTITEKLLWIGKFFLAKEIEEETYKNQNYINDFANKLINLSTTSGYNEAEAKKLFLEAGKLIKQLISKQK